MSNNLLSKNITEQMQEEAEIQIRDKKKVVDYNTIEYPIEVMVQKYLVGLDDDSNELFIKGMLKTPEKQQRSCVFRTSGRG